MSDPADFPAACPWIGSDMSTITERLVSRLERWMDRLIVPDDRYVCGGCDDRFISRSMGVAHVLRCHPEFQGVVVYEDAVTHFVVAT
jgi:hypothetical protein